MTSWGRIGWRLGLAVALSSVCGPRGLSACSTFKLQKGNVLLYGHNLNQPGMNVPGLIFVNKRGTFKIGRSWNEMLSVSKAQPSSLSWIARYGSVTFSTFGRDMPDGGINEAGLYIWEMNDDTEYPRNEALPKLLQMNWMQYVLDNFSNLEEAIASASQIEIGGWGWHYFLGDREGRCASLEFIHGQVVVHAGEAMPVPALCNEPYAKEIELLDYFQGFGGLYAPTLDDRKVPRFVKTAAMIRDFDPSQDAVAYGLRMLAALQVNEVPKWSVLVDARRGDVYFKTAAHPEIKSFSMTSFDFSNQSPVRCLNVDQSQGGDVTRAFHPASDAEIGALIASLPIPPSFLAQGGINREEFDARFTTHHHAGAELARQYFAGIWTATPRAGKPPKSTDPRSVELQAFGDAVRGEILTTTGEAYPLEHIRMVNEDMSFTFRNVQGTILLAAAKLKENTMVLQLRGIEDSLGNFTLIREP
jgi:penicillin V acylase-like amidase (Ntn superfamily)